MPRIPGVPLATDLLRVLQDQAEALRELPATLTALNRSVRGLAEMIAATRDTLVTVQRLTARVEGVLDEIEQPLRALRPGLERVAVVLDDPVIDQVPGLVHKLSDDVLPLIRDLRDTHVKVAYIASSTERLVTIVEGAGGRLAALPGAGLFARRRPPDEEPGLGEDTP